MLVEHRRFPASTSEAVRWQFAPDKVEQPVSLQGILQFSPRLLALTGVHFTNTNWQLPEDDPFVQAAALGQPIVAGFIARCGTNFNCLQQSIDLS